MTTAPGNAAIRMTARRQWTYKRCMGERRSCRTATLRKCFANAPSGDTDRKHRCQKQDGNDSQDIAE
jgi:hypothetical protein